MALPKVVKNTAELAKGMAAAARAAAKMRIEGDRPAPADHYATRAAHELRRSAS